MSTSPYSGKSYGSAKGSSSSPSTTSGKTYQDTSGNYFNSQAEAAASNTSKGTNPKASSYNKINDGARQIIDPTTGEYKGTQTIASTDITDTTKGIDTFKEAKFDANGILAGAGITSDNYIAQAQANIDKQSNDTQKMYKDLFASISSPEQNLASAKQSSGMDAAQQIANE